jgi:hypothetical protein
MLPKATDKLLALFENETRWCQDAEARDTYGSPVKFHDPLATAWDITGAMCCLFGWKRARTLFGQLERHIHSRRRLHNFNRDEAIESMVTLQAYNDRPGTPFELILTLLETMPVWTGVSRPSNGSARSVESRRGEVLRASASLSTTILEKKTESYVKAKKSQYPA